MRRRNVRAALERIIEQAGEVDVTAQAVMTAVQAYAKINAQGQWIDRTEPVDLNELFERMPQGELEVYARDGKLPDWFTEPAIATPTSSQLPKTMGNSNKIPSLPATDMAPRPGDFPVGSALSRAAARMSLTRKRRAEELGNRAPDVRIVCDLPRNRIEVESSSAERVRCNRVDRYVQGDEIVEMVFPVHTHEGECLGVCSVPTDVRVEEALRLLRQHRRD